MERVYSLPLSVDFDITLKCNLNCIHCNVQAGKIPEKEMSTNTIKKIIDQLNDIGIVDIAITGGEPLCRSDWKEIVRHTCNYKTWRVSLNTNGILWQDDDFKFISGLEKPPLAVVSLDGHTSETYSILRNIAGSINAKRIFNKVLENIEKISNVCPVCINFTITNLNHMYFFKTIELVKKFNINSFLGIKFFPVGRGLSNYKDLAISYSNWKSLLLEATRNKIEKRDFYESVFISVTCPWEFLIPLKEINLSLNDILDLWNYLPPLANPNFRDGRGLGCTAGITNFGLSSDGTIFPCGTISANVHGLECGNVRESSVKDVWENSEILNYIRTLKFSDIEGLCNKCSFRKICGGGCRARAFSLTGSLKGPDKECPIISKKEKII